MRETMGDLGFVSSPVRRRWRKHIRRGAAARHAVTRAFSRCVSPWSVPLGDFHRDLYLRGFLPVRAADPSENYQPDAEKRPRLGPLNHPGHVLIIARSVPSRAY